MICEECITTAMRGSDVPAMVASQYRMWHAVRHGVTPTVNAPADPAALSDLDEQVLRFERYWWRRSGAKVQAVADIFGLGAVTYYARLNELLTLPAALAFDGLLVNRLRRQRDDTARLRLAMR